MDVDLDFAAVHADDELLDTLGLGRPVDGFDDDPVTEVLVALREDVDSVPIPEPRVPESPVAGPERGGGG